MTRERPIIEVRRVEYGHDWHLHVPANKTEPARVFWLGQDVKFCSRVLGWDAWDFISAVNDYLHRKEYPLVIECARVQQAMAAVIIRCLGGLRRVRKLEVWGLCAQ